MKKFKDLQAGDTVYIGFEKKVITKIVPDKDYPEDGVVIYISRDEFYYVYGHLSADYCDNCCDNLYDPNEWIFTEKDAIVAHLSEKLRDIQIDYENRKSLCEKWLFQAKELE